MMRKKEKEERRERRKNERRKGFHSAEILFNQGLKVHL